MTVLVAIAAAAGVALGLCSLVVSDRQLAARLASEGAAIESSQFVLYVAALVLSLRTAWRRHRAARPMVFDVLILAGLGGIVIGEVDFDRHLFGVKVIATRFFVDGQVWLPYRVLAVVVIVGTPLAIGLYALRQWRQLWRSGWEALQYPWGRVLLAAVLTVGGAQLFERPLGRVGELPRSFLEESLELIAAIWFLVAATDRWRVLPERKPPARAGDGAGSADHDVEASGPPLARR